MGRLIKNIKVDQELFLHIKKALLDSEREGLGYNTANDYLKQKLGFEVPKEKPVFNLTQK